MIAKLQQKVEGMKISIEEQATDMSIVLEENMKLRSKPGPNIYVGNIPCLLHTQEMKNDAKMRGKPHPDPYFWPKKWFPNHKDKIVYESRLTQ